MARLVVLDRKLNQKHIEITDNIPDTIDIISPQKTNFEIRLNKDISVGDLVFVSKEDYDYIGIISEIKNENTSILYTYPLISITDVPVVISDINGDVFAWIKNTLETNFVNSSDPLFNLALTIENKIITATTLKHTFESDNLFDALITIFKKTGIYLDFGLVFDENGRPSSILCEVHNNNDEAVINMRDDNPLMIKEPIYNFDYSGTNKVIYKPSGSGNIIEAYLLKDNTITLDPNAENRIYPIVQEILEYDSESSTISKDIAESAEELMLGNVNQFNIQLQIKGNPNYPLTPFRKFNLITKKSTYETYITKVVNHNDEYYDIVLGVVRNTLTDKLKEISKSKSTISKASSGSSGGGSSINVVDSLTSYSTSDALSANQGRVLKELNDSTLEKLDDKVDKVIGKQLTTNDYTDDDKAKLESLENYNDTELRGLINNKANQSALDNLSVNLNTKIDNKVDKVDGKGLSTNDYTNADKTKLQGLENYDDTALDTRVKSSIVGVAMNSGTGVFTFTRDDGTSFVVDTLLEKVVTNFTYNSQTQSLELTLEDGTTQSVPMSAFIDTYTGYNGSMVNVQVEDNVIYAGLKDGTIPIDKFTNALQTKINSVDNKVDKVSGKGLSTNDYSDTEKGKVSNSIASVSNNTDNSVKFTRADGTSFDLDLSKYVDTYTGNNGEMINVYIYDNVIYAAIKSASIPIESLNGGLQSKINSVDNKVDKVDGKGLSTNDYTTAEKTKLAGLSNYDDTAVRNLINNKASLDASNLSDSNVISWKEKLGVNSADTSTNSLLVAEYTASTNSPTITINGLDLLADGGIYDFVLYSEPVSTSENYNTMQFNNVTTSSYYYIQQYIRYNGTYGGSGTTTDRFQIQDAGTSNAFTIGSIIAGNNRVYYECKNGAFGSDNYQMSWVGFIDTISNVTSIKLLSPQQFKTGTKIKIYKRATNNPTRS